MVKKTDNGHLLPKLDLRRYFMRKYHADGSARVMDCCSGSGRLWFQLRREFVIASYWAIDVKPKAGRLKVDSARVLAQPGWAENVIDIDTYGSPWKHWAAMLPNIGIPTTVFLTVGRRNIAHANASPTNIPWADYAIVGAEQVARAIPPGTRHVLFRSTLELIAATHLSRALIYGKVVECREAATASLTRYIGVRLEPSASAAKP